MNDQWRHEWIETCRGGRSALENRPLVYGEGEVVVSKGRVVRGYGWEGGEVVEGEGLDDEEEGEGGRRGRREIGTAQANIDCQHCPGVLVTPSVTRRNTTTGAAAAMKICATAIRLPYRGDLPPSRPASLPTPHTFYDELSRYHDVEMHSQRLFGIFVGCFATRLLYDRSLSPAIRAQDNGLLTGKNKAKCLSICLHEGRLLDGNTL